MMGLVEIFIFGAPMYFINCEQIAQDNARAVVEGRAERPNAATQAVLDAAEMAREARRDTEHKAEKRLREARAEIYSQWPIPAGSGGWYMGDRPGVLWAHERYSLSETAAFFGGPTPDRYLNAMAPWWPEYLDARESSDLAAEIHELETQIETCSRFYREESNAIDEAIAAQQVGMEERLAAQRQVAGYEG